MFRESDRFSGLPLRLWWAARPHARPNPKCVCLEITKRGPSEKLSPEVETMNSEKIRLFSRDWIEGRFKALVDRTIRERRREERRFTEQRTTKHRFKARKSCIADARSYRIARSIPVLAPAQFGFYPEE
ncbi:MAG: hypothetical protein DMF00_08245 [Verrucomicrobia bacterium]|nr:MAG: hypothetical protein DMF00_08245 [Verrucomicrobiota bacterium]